ncbi:hypothetical protein HDU91_001903 [Kappamyces sp. JEL0680]|nr:hypothetical protein HDU91_001903 [Kappamyces sp. JEL0680]
MRWKMDRLRKASLTIQSFFKEVYDVSKLLKVVKKYRFSVIKAQRYIREFLLVREARILAITKVWDSQEANWWTQRQKGVKGSYEFIDEKKAKDKGKKKKGKKDDADKATRIPEFERGGAHACSDVKRKVILGNLILRRKQFWKSWIAASNEGHASIRDPTGQQLRPVFKVGRFAPC